MLRFRSSEAVRSAGSRLFHASAIRFGKDQIGEVPNVTSRPPKNNWRYDFLFDTEDVPDPSEKQLWKFLKKWELQMQDEWDEGEAFRHLPKPKKQFGNEATEIIWPYALLMENVIKIHPFTKSIYVYYPQHPVTPAGKASIDLAKRFSRECLVPITFHNSQCYIETEMLLEYGDTPWLVIHCLDGRHRIIRIEAPTEGSATDPKTALLVQVLEAASELGKTTDDPKGTLRTMHERPLQNAYLRIDYQWLGRTAEDRMRHTVQWEDAEKARGDKVYERFRDDRVNHWLNHGFHMPLSNKLRAEFHRVNKTSPGRREESMYRQFLHSGAKKMRNSGGVNC